MLTQNFYKKYNMGRERFASVIGVGKGSLIKYENDDPTLRKSTKQKIEKSVRVIVKYNLIYPRPWRGFDGRTNILYSHLNKLHYDEYVTKFKLIYEEES